MFSHRRESLAVMAITVACIVLVLEHVVLTRFQNKLAEARASQTQSRSGQTSEKLLQKDTPTPTPGKTLVYRFNGIHMQTLHEFCTWSVQFDCVPLKTPSGSTPIHIHDVLVDVYVSKSIKDTGHWENNNINLILSELDKDPELGFMDLGSHVGAFSLSVATTGRKVVSVDPLIENVQRLCKSIQKGGLTDRMTIIFNPLGANNTLVNIKRSPGNVGASNVVAWRGESSHASACQEPTASYTVTLDDTIPYLPFKKAVIKMDIEKFEFFVISSAKSFFQEIHVPAMLMEWDLMRSDINGGRLVHLLLSLNFSAYEPRIGGKKLDPMMYKSWPIDVLWKK